MEQTTNDEYKIFILNDVMRQGNPDILISPDADTLKKYIPDGVFPSAINAFLVQRGDSNYLFDTGMGFKILENLAALNVAPEKVHHIFITHAHGDHIGGLLKDSLPIFPNAQLHINRVEYDYWVKEQNPQFLQIVEKYKQHLHLFDIEDTTANKPLFADIEAIAAYGHTPGHTMYLVKGAAPTLIWGDLTHVMPVQMPHPEYSVSYDTSPEQAAKIRENTLKFAAENNIQIAGMHIAEGLGKVTKSVSTGYKFEGL
ncbi:MAG: MBL fold metallo-hydrolase [Paludibacter sp.]|nr:MBL fold metallo-hydrolase [Paludibacter sp.]